MATVLMVFMEVGYGCGFETATNSDAFWMWSVRTCCFRPRASCRRGERSIFAMLGECALGAYAEFGSRGHGADRTCVLDVLLLALIWLTWL